MNKPTVEMLESQDLTDIELEKVIVPQIESIFTQLSRHQIELLKSGEPDDFAKGLFAKLLLDLIESLTKARAEALNDNGVAVLQHLLISDLSKALAMSFSETFNIKQACADQLADVIVTEAKGSLQSLSSEDCVTILCTPTDTTSVHGSGTETLAQEQSLDINVVEDRTPSSAASVSAAVYVEPGEGLELQTKKKMMFVRLLLEKLVSKTYKEAKIDIRLGKPEAIIEELYDESLAEVKNIDFDTSRKGKKLYKAIFKELHENSNNSYMQLLVSMQTDSKKVAKCIASSIRSHLTKPKQCNPTSNFFSPLLGQIFRQTNRVGIV
uniref:uncharacterized protein LOC109966410 isoform X1 n=1 Tax=Monopterus albus TaxID=43700 RepID=UPI0009B3B42F|nr:uncharacterized protein LOC109966410 isoform X1 [Monopterus albus]XP_020466888.1 uncharacterized protein LOC109966410 isoform X2 [Monopterus albus]